MRFNPGLIMLLIILIPVALFLGVIRKLWDWFFVDLEWLDDKIIGHNFYWLCDFIAKHYPGGWRRKSWKI